MIVKIVILVLLCCIYIFYCMYLKKYFKVRRVFRTLGHFLDARDTQLLKLVPEISDKNLQSEIIEAIGKRHECFKMGQNEAIASDIYLNSCVKKFYEEFSKIEKNEVQNSVFVSIIELEKELKNIRSTYNEVVEDYNSSLIKHKFVCLRLIRMKILDIYGKK